jgi:hypothetical protein
MKGRERDWREQPDIRDDRELAAVNAAHDAMRDLVTDNFDAACAIGLAAVDAFRRAGAEQILELYGIGAAPPDEQGAEQEPQYELVGYDDLVPGETVGVEICIENDEYDWSSRRFVRREGNYARFVSGDTGEYLVDVRKDAGRMFRRRVGVAA